MKQLFLSTVAILVFYASVFASVGPSNQEYGLLVEINRDRAAHGQLPLRWQDDLFLAAKFKSDEQAAHGGNCHAHNSCNGELWYKRIGRYYPSWTALGETVSTSTLDARDHVDGWIDSESHRNILRSGSFTDFGGAISPGMTNFGVFGFATGDFGSRGMIPLTLIPILPAGTALSNGDGTYALSVNYYSNQFAPAQINAVVEGDCRGLLLVDGSRRNGTYSLNYRPRSQSCPPVYFEVEREDGVVARFPTNYSIALGVDCADAVADGQRPACAISGEPSPTPTPGVSTLSHLRFRQRSSLTVLEASFDLADSPIGYGFSLTIGDRTFDFPDSCLRQIGAGVRYICEGDVKFKVYRSNGSWRFRFEHKEIWAPTSSNVLFRVGEISFVGNF